MDIIKEAERIFGGIAIPMRGDEVRAMRVADAVAGGEALAFLVDWEKRTVRCLIKRRVKIAGDSQGKIPTAD